MAAAKPRSANKKSPKSRGSAASRHPHGQAASSLRPAVDDAAADVVTYGQRDDVVALARQLADQWQLDPTWVRDQLAQARYQPSIARLVMPAAAGSAKNWQAYRNRFVEPLRIRAGLQWWQANATALAQAEARWGVPASVVVAIVGVETLYGRQTGGYKVIDSLATLTLDFPTGRSDRSGFYRNELASFLKWCAREGRDPQSVKGSYAGAIGLPQFMPGSILQWAVDFDGDGRIDLERDGADVVGSVANFLAEHGWERGSPTHFAVAAPTDTRERALLLAPDILPSFTATQLRDRGAELDAAGERYNGPLALVELQNGPSAPSYVAGTRNFYAITRYNWSSYYAMAVIELADALAPQHALETSSNSRP
jgi:membrane-bound lytic murein transglycosylase B